MPKILLLLLLLSGLALGPAYWIYAKFFSGRLVETLELTVGADARIESAGFRIDPAMKPVGLVLHAAASFKPNMDDSKPPANVYTATLLRDGAPLLTTELRLAATSVQVSEPVFKERLFWLEGAEAGDYRLLLTPARAPEMTAGPARLEVRAEMIEPDGRWVSGGLLLLAAGLFGWFLS